MSNTFCFSSATHGLWATLGNSRATDIFGHKAKTQVCDITDYGAITDGETDAGGAINEALAACQNGGLVYIPPGVFTIETCVVLNDGLASAVQLHGTLIRTTTTCDYMISARACTDFEFFSGNSKGAIQGLVYELHGDAIASGPRFFNFQEVANFSVHGLAAVDSPTYYLNFNDCASGEVYNIIVL
jgi:rhamnogalacturonan hydrolase